MIAHNIGNPGNILVAFPIYTASDGQAKISKTVLIT